MPKRTDIKKILIIGSGPNSCILHHMTNDRRIGDNELVVLDIGAVGYVHQQLLDADGIAAGGLVPGG